MRSVVWHLAFWIAAISGCSGCIGCGKVEDPWPDKPGPRVMVTFGPLYCFAANVAGDDASVLCLMGNVGPHDYRPTAHDAFKLKRADLFFTNGLDLDETVANNLKKTCGNPNLELIELGESECLKEKLLKMDHGPAHAGHQHGEHDPHVWLGIPEAICMVESIRDTLKQKDPAHAEGYEKRASAYIERLKKLQKDGLAALADKKDRNLISFHESLKYFARTFKLDIVASLEQQPGLEPDANHIRDLVNLCKDKHVRLIAVEPQYPHNTSANKLLEEIRLKGVSDAAFVVVDPIETVPPDDLTHDYYETKMRENIANLAKSMK
jgi:zinc transport system substrate-binding protein